MELQHRPGWTLLSDVQKAIGWVYSSRCLRDPARNFLILTGTTASGWINPVRLSLSPQRNSGLSASSNVVINYTADIQQPVGLSAIPRFLSWQMAYRQSW